VPAFLNELTAFFGVVHDGADCVFSCELVSENELLTDDKNESVDLFEYFARDSLMMLLGCCVHLFQHENTRMMVSWVIFKFIFGAHHLVIECDLVFEIQAGAAVLAMCRFALLLVVDENFAKSFELLNSDVDCGFSLFCAGRFGGDGFEDEITMCDTAHFSLMMMPRAANERIVVFK